MKAKFDIVKSLKKSSRENRLEREFMVGKPIGKAINSRPSVKQDRKSFKQNRHLISDW